MNEIVINGNAVSAKEYNGKRVVTFRDIDNVHERPKGTAKRNFNSNKKHFIEGEDYFIIKPSDVQQYEFRTTEINNRGTVFITESGYYMLVKSFTDELSWTVQRELVNNYFKKKELEINLEEIIAKTATAVATEIAKQFITASRQETKMPAEPVKKIAKAYKYSTPSKISTLPPEIKEQVDEMLRSGNYSCQSVANFIINSTGMYISQMSVNRYKRNNFEIIII